MKRAKRIPACDVFVLMAAILTLATAADASAAEHTKDSLETVRKNIEGKKAVLLDVREQREWDAGHLKWASLLALSELREKGDSKDFADELAKKFPKKKIIYCHCRSGGRVLPASDILKQMGYDVRPLKAGYQKLIEAGFPKAKPQKP